MNSTAGPATAHFPRESHQPKSLRTLASNHVNWTGALLKHPESTSLRIHGLYEEYLEALKQAHKHRLTLCMNEAFYHHLPVDQLYRDALSFLQEHPTLSWTERDQIATRVAALFPNTSEHARKVIRATAAACSLRHDALHFGNMRIAVIGLTWFWQQNFTSDPEIVHDRIIDR
ncbi:hypothetical protein HK097_004827, partial [Rhizophlyctis rosea]